MSTNLFPTSLSKPVNEHEDTSSSTAVPKNNTNIINNNRVDDFKNATNNQQPSLEDTNKLNPIVQKNLRDLGLVPDGDRYQAIVKRFAGSFGFATVQNGPYSGIDILVHQNALITHEDGIYRKLAPGDYIECMVNQQQHNKNDEIDNNGSVRSDRLCATYVTGPNAGLLRCEILHHRNHPVGNKRKYPIRHIINDRQHG